MLEGLLVDKYIRTRSSRSRSASVRETRHAIVRSSILQYVTPICNAFQYVHIPHPTYTREHRYLDTASSYCTRCIPVTIDLGKIQHSQQLRQQAVLTLDTRHISYEDIYILENLDTVLYVQSVDKIDYVLCLVLVFSLPSHLPGTIFALLFISPSYVPGIIVTRYNSDPGSHTVAGSSPLRTTIGPCLAFLSRKYFSYFFPRRLASNCDG